MPSSGRSWTLMQTLPSFVYLIPAVMLIGIAGMPTVRCRNDDLRRAAGYPADEPRYPAGGQGSCRSGQGLRRDETAGAVQGGDSAGAADDHGRRQPDDHDGHRDGRHLFADRRARASATRLSSASGRLEPGRGIVAGTAIVIMAIVFDRLTQGIVKQKDEEPPQ